VVVAAIVGAALGSKLLCWIQHPVETWAHRADLGALLHGKSIVGGLLGGLVAVEWVKRWMGIRRPTGDLFVLPLCLGIAIGRIGCFLTGLDDQTFGAATGLPWGVDFGDGVRRHPVQVYEIAFLAAVSVWAARRLGVDGRGGPVGETTRGAATPPGGAHDGLVFRGFMILYLSFRLAVEFIKPDPRIYLGLSGIQLACIAGLLYYGIQAAGRQAAPTPLPALDSGGAAHGG